MIERTGDVFTTTATYIAHGVNCQGFMGAGIAKTVRSQFPKTYGEYNRLCKTGEFRPGAYFALRENNKVIVNLATQDQPGPDASYPWVFTSAYRFAAVASREANLARYGNVIAIPEIGCGIGGLKWSNVRNILLTIENIFPDIEFEVWHYGS